MKTLIAIPCMDVVAAGFAQSLAMLNRVGDCYVTLVAGSLVYDSRNKIASKAVELGVDYVLWIDSDMILAPDTLEKLMKHMEAGKNIVSGVYYRRSGSYTPVMFKSLTRLEDGGVKSENYDDYPKDAPFKVAGVGFGCVLMRASILFEMFAQYNDWFTPEGRAGEDVSFCMRATDMGFEIWVDPSVQCGHVGQVIVTKDFYDAYKMAEEQKRENKG